MASKKPKGEKDAAANDAEPVVLPANAPDGNELMTLANTACDGLIATVIDSPMMYKLAAAELVDMQVKYRELEEKRFAITRPMDAAKKAVMSLFTPPLEKLDRAIKAHKAGMLAYDNEQKRKAAEQQALLDKIAEQQRANLAAEQAKQAELARKEHERAQQLMAAGGDSEGITAALNAAEEAHAMSLALQQTGAVVSAATAATNVPAVEGVTTADVWKAEVIDLAALLHFIADKPEYHHWIEVKMTGPNEQAKSQRTAMCIPGLKAVEESRIVAGNFRKAA